MPDQGFVVPEGWGQPPTGPAPKQPMTKSAKIAIGIVGGLVLIGGCTALTGSKSTATASKPAPAAALPQPTVTETLTVAVTAPAAPAPTVTVTVTATAAPPPAPAAAPADTFAGSGTYLVGTDVQPGTYKTAGPGAAGMCYWERNSSADGGFGSILANDNLSGQGVVTIKKSDVVFKSQGCQDWVKAG